MSFIDSVKEQGCKLPVLCDVHACDYSILMLTTAELLSALNYCHALNTHIACIIHIESNFSTQKK